MIAISPFYPIKLCAHLSGSRRSIRRQFINSMGIFSIILALGLGLSVSAAPNGEGCNIPQTPHNGNFDVSGCEGILADPFDPPCWKDPSTKFPVGRIVHYFCLSNYVLRGTKSIVCMKSGNWSHPFPKCCKRRVLKSQPLAPTSTLAGGNGRTAEKFIPGSTLDVYELAAEKRLELEAHDQADAVSCPALQQTKNVEFECRSPNGELHNCERAHIPPYTVAHLKCSKYFRSSSDLAYRYRKCKPDGVWSTEGSINCIADCGKSDIPKRALITNGILSDLGQWPWHVAIYIVNGKNEKEHICGGSLISKYAVLTAAHCVTEIGTTELRSLTSIVLAFGKHKRDFNYGEETVQIRQPKEMHLADGYNPLNFESDIAIIVVDLPLDYTFYVRPVCIPEHYNSLIEEYQVQPGNLGTVVGWGLTEEGIPSEDLRMARLPVVSSTVCIDSFQQFFQQNKRYTNFCAGYRNGKTGVCNGDSGGMMVFPSGQGNDLRWYLQGIVSVGAPDPEDSSKCNSKLYSLFTRVGRFADWIVRTLTPDGYL